MNRTWQLEGDCYRYCSDFSKAITAYETFLERAKLTKYERMDAQCSYCVVLYESGEISRPLEHLRTLLSELQKETGPQAASILVRTLSCLTSIEETLCDPMHEFHFNAALDIAKRYHLEDEYYVLLRKSLIVHKGVYGISLMESARVYFERIGNQKELACGGASAPRRSGAGKEQLPAQRRDPSQFRSGNNLCPHQWPGGLLVSERQF